MNCRLKEEVLSNSLTRIGTSEVNPIIFYTMANAFPYLLSFVFLPILLSGQPMPVSQIQSLADEHSQRTLKELVDFLTLPNNAQRPAQLEPNLVWLEQAFSDRGFQTERLPTTGIDLLLAEYQHDPALPTVMVYVHVDGQPVDPTQWQQVHPFTPTLKRLDADNEWKAIDIDSLYTDPNPEWRLFARSSADAKGPILMLLTAWDALRSADRLPPYNVKVIMDTEEEIGSPHLPAAVQTHRDRLVADHLIILDGPPHFSNQPTLVFGARGIATVHLTIYGPRAPLHSGHYGNYAPNPAMRLAQLLASMKDQEGRVIIPGWYDGITIEDSDRQAFAQVPDDLPAINRQLGIGGIDAVGSSLQEALQYPSLNIGGMAAGWVGAAARTIVPAEAVAHIDIRLVRESDPERLIRLLRDHIQQQGYHLLETEPTDAEREQHPRLASMAHRISYAAFRTDMDSPIGRWLESAMTHTFNQEPIKIRTLGGSVPISPFVQTLGVPAVLVPLVNPDNNQHSPNENLRLGNYTRGVVTLLGIFTTSPEEVRE